MKDKIQPKKTEQQKMQDFAKDYQELCEKHNYRIVVTPSYIARDDGTFSTTLQRSVGKLPKNRD